MKRIVAAVAFLCLLVTATHLFAQTGSSTVGGIVQDSSKALIPGVTITLTNTETGVARTQLSNEAGAYSFASVPPGPYKLKAELAGFKQAVASDLAVGTNAQVRWDFSMEIGQVNTQVEVSVATEQLLTESSASVGVVLPERNVKELPLVGQNVLDLLNVLPGYRSTAIANSGANGSTDTVGGLSLDVINATINGLSTVSSRDSASFWGHQVLTTNVINPDLVGEIRLILSPVDAELGRGNAQIQIQTRSGTNKYAGSAVWNIQNTGFNANTWANNRTTATVDGVTVWSPTRPDWYNINQFTGSYGGPIRKNKTFFFVLYDQQFVHRRELVTTQVLTDTARQGIWRYWEGWNPGNALQPLPTSFATGNATPTGTYPAIDFNGNPVAPLYNANGTTPYTGGLRCFSLFGNVKVDGTPFTPADCPGGTAVSRNSPWDQFRPSVDTTGYIKNILKLMPHANFFATFGGVNPDGLNSASYRWVRSRTGASGNNPAIGIVTSSADYNNRNQINLKIDHNFNTKHRVAVAWTYERDAGANGLAAWDGVLNGASARRPQFVTVQGTSTLSPTLVNEARFGLNYSTEYFSPPWANPTDASISSRAQKYILTGGSNPTSGKAYPILYNPGTNFNGYLGFSAGDYANYSPLWNWADTIRWTRGKHSFSVGGEYRRPETTGWNNSPYINATPGNPASATSTNPLLLTITNFANELPNFLQTGRTNAVNLLYVLNGSIASANTGYWINGQSDIKNGTWQDVTTAKDTVTTTGNPWGHQSRTEIQREWSFFAKDDYKLTRRLTLNLGIRYDYSYSPYLNNGLTNTFAGDGLGLFGAGRPKSGDIFSNWLKPGNLFFTGYGSNVSNPLQCQTGVQQSPLLPVSNCDPSLMSTVIYVGPGTDHPDKSLIPQSGRFSPAIGFAWQLPWFGEGKTTMRGGFQRTYGQAGSPFSGGLLSGPGGDSASVGIDVSNPATAAILANRAINLSDLATLVPGKATRLPGGAIPIAGRSVNITYSMYDPDFVTPYTDNITLSVQRSLRRNMNLELRFVNTRGRYQGGAGGALGTAGTYNINTPNVFHNPELFKALEVTRAGGNDPLFDQMLAGLNLNTGVAGYGAVGTVVNGVFQTGSAQIRRAFATNIANGNYSALITQLLTAGTTGTGGLQSLPNDPATGTTVVASQRVLRNGCDRIANGLYNPALAANTATNIPTRCFSEDYLIANPQLNSASYAKNFGYTDYRAFEAQFTMRPTHGMSAQATYGFSKTMQQPGNGFTDPLSPTLDYGLAPSSIGHDFRTNGVLELPIGPNKLLLPNSSGWLARSIERWQVGFIFSASQGAPTSFLGNNMLYANGRPDIVGPWNNPRGQISWSGDNGNFFGNPSPFATFQDPQCTQNVGGTDANGFNLQSSCTLLGLARVVDAGTPGAIPLANGKYGIPLLENPLPGRQGNLGKNTMLQAGRWALDANISKSFQIGESKALQLRVDAINAPNHPTPGNPVGLNGTTGFNDNFGQITSKSGSRTFQAKLRLTF